jgi:hypothetical protein
MATNRDFVVKNGLVVTEDIELGHASDTTIARASAGQITVEGTAVVLAGSASHDGFSDFVANEHIDHSGVSISAGNGLTGGGTIASTRTLAVGAGTGITVNSNDVAVTAAQTGITSVLNSSLKLGYGASDAYINFGTDNQIDFSIDNAAQLILTDGVFRPAGSNDIALGQDAKRWSSVSTVGLSIGGTNSSAATMTAILDEDDMASDSATALATQQSIKAYVDSQSGGATSLNGLSDVTYSSGDLTISSLDTLVVGGFTIDSSGDISLDADGADIRLKDAGTTYANLAHDGGHFKIKAVVNDADMYFVVKDNNSNVDALILDGSDAGAATFNAGVTIGGDLIIPDDIVHSGNTNNLISFGADTQSFETSGTARFNISDSGLQIGTGARVTTILDEDNMASDSATALATQQSIKAYVDASAGGGGGISLNGSTANGILTFGNSTTADVESNLTFDGTTLGVTASGTSTTLLLESTDAGAADAPILELYRNSSSPANTDDLGQILWSAEKSDGSKYSITKMYAQINTVDNSDRLMINIASSGGSGLNNYEYLRFDGGVRDVIINEGGQDIDFRIEGDSDSVLFFTDASSDRIGIGTNSPDAKLHVSSGTDLDCGIIIEADTDNNDEDDLPFLWFKQDGDITVHAIQATSNRLQIINNISASGGIDFALGTTNNTGTTNPSTGTTTALSIESDGGVQARKTVIKAVSSNTTLADEDSGKTIYWTGGTLALPANAEVGQQFVIINNTNGAATPNLNSNTISTNWTAHAAMADETARTYISVEANKWIYIG